MIFSILSVGLYRIVSSQIQWVGRIEERIVSEYLAKSACSYAIAKIAKDETSYDTLYELGQSQSQQLGRGKFIYTLQDEESKIPINVVSSDILERLPGFNLGVAEAMVQSSLKPFHLKEELLTIEEMSEALFVESKDFITVYSSGKVNVNTAPSEILTALGFDEALVTMVMNFRQGSDHQPATSDDGIFESTGDIFTRLNSFGGLSEAQQDTLNQILGQGLLTVTSENFSVSVQTEMDDHPLIHYTIVIGTKGIKQWRES